MTITITLTEAQARAVAAACDLAGRVAMGQWRDVRYACHTAETDMDNLDLVDDLLMTAKHLHMPTLPLNAYHGIRSPAIDVQAKRATDVGDVLRHAVAWAKTPTGGITVDFDPPRSISGDALPVATVAE